MEKEEFTQKKQTVYNLINDKDYEPIKFKEMAMLLKVPKEEKDDLRQVLEELILEGKIILKQNGKYKKSDENILTGVFEGSTRGFGFVTIEGEEKDIFVGESATKGALNGDIVQVKVNRKKTGKHREGEIIAILSRTNTQVVGTYQKSKNFGFVISDNLKFGKDVFIPKSSDMGAVSGHKVVVELIDYGDKGKKPEGKIVEIIGHINDPGTDIMAIVKANNLPVEFTKPVLTQLKSIPEEVEESELSGRLDLRGLQTVTIDGEDAKDLDDAITITKEGSIYRLGVHIADVTHYVRENSELDKEALRRGTSVYLVDRVIPMLPHKLSNGICSLNAGTDRLALSCIMDVDEKGNVIKHKIAETVINVDKRMTYTSVKKILEDNDMEERKEYEEFVPMFELMSTLADILKTKRKQRGSIDFDFPESKIILDKGGRVEEIKAFDRNTATKIIEDFMLLANETVAENFFWQELPFVYRTHDKPEEEKIQKLGTFINNFGYSIKIGNENIHPKELQKLLTKVENTPEEMLISRVTLRSMRQARYKTACEGHFGLSTKYYCHFTSPIRRYPDLQIHRIIKENLVGKLSEKRVNHYERILPEVANQSSLTERRAEEVEREVVKLKKIEYMEKFVGEEFDGVISGVTNWGLYVELENTVEGMIHVTSLKDDYYFFDEEHYVLMGERTHNAYKLGEKIRIQVVKADRLTRTIDFELVKEEEKEYE